MTISETRMLAILVGAAAITWGVAALPMAMKRTADNAPDYPATVPRRMHLRSCATRPMEASISTFEFPGLQSADVERDCCEYASGLGQLCTSSHHIDSGRFQ